MRTADMPAVKSVAVPDGLSDGEFGVPADYRAWPKFLVGVEKDQAKQIRDIYISPRGHGVDPGQVFPNGTVSVMEIWKAKTGADGALQRDASGRLIKDDLSLIFVMAKSMGAGDKVAPQLRTGDWVYSGFQADGKTVGGPPAATCRSCHLQQASTDWLFRVDEFRAAHRNR